MGSVSGAVTGVTDVEVELIVLPVPPLIPILSLVTVIPPLEAEVVVLTEGAVMVIMMLPREPEKLRDWVAPVANTEVNLPAKAIETTWVETVGL